MYADAGKREFELGGPLARAIAHDAEVYSAELLKLARLLERLATRAGRDRKPAK